MKPLVVALIFGFLAIPAWARLQTIVVTGKIMCKANPVVSTPVPTTGNVTANPTNNDFHGLVELYDYDSCRILIFTSVFKSVFLVDPDDLLDKRLVNNNDEFTVFGEENEFFSITPTFSSSTRATSNKRISSTATTPTASTFRLTTSTKPTSTILI
ncbi:hypothetical protein L596_006132 [Steinernema carpocapsae]|uniref:NtA domain-containing protein n=1 Tax=Steinernema carpocapsae TaxID=34508 RepID=A0A4U8V170_STECR|nr:hypothetical protein L596_006132 [Steinernema carpocapsae]